MDVGGRSPILTELGEGITLIDTAMAGHRELNAVYLIASVEPTLVETGPAADGPVVLEALERLGIAAGDLAHLVVTHIHLDHAGGAGGLLRRFPRAVVWVHERGAPHLEDPTRLVASTARTYGRDRMLAFFGRTDPCPLERIRPVTDGSRIPLGDRALRVLHTPGHASHHVALCEEASGSVFTGEAVGSYLPWARCIRPALPPPGVDVEAALASIEAIRASRPSILLASHHGPIREPEAFLDLGAERIRRWAETVRSRLEHDPQAPDEAIAEVLTAQARTEYERDSGGPFDLPRYDALGSIRMNAQGLARYWRKRWERERQDS
jgi:glyoxylase-like metal-dependent hydrolase (beta-lactamase superfamily II)